MAENEKDEIELVTHRMIETVHEKVERELKRRYSTYGAIVSIILSVGIGISVYVVTLKVEEVTMEPRIDLAVTQKIYDMQNDKLNHLTNNLEKASLLQNDIISQLNDMYLVANERLTEINRMYDSIEISGAPQTGQGGTIETPQEVTRKALTPIRQTLELSDWMLTVDAWHGDGKEYRKIGNQKEVTVKVEILKDGELIHKSNIDKILAKGSDGNNTDYPLDDIEAFTVDVSDAKEVVVVVSYIGSSGAEEMRKFVFQKINDWQLDKNSLRFTSDQTSNPEYFNASVHMRARVRYQ